MMMIPRTTDTASPVYLVSAWSVKPQLFDELYPLALDRNKDGRALTLSYGTC